MTMISAPIQQVQEQERDHEQDSEQEQSIDGLSPDVFADLVFYFKYASSAYTLKCPRPNGQILVTQVGSESTKAHGYIARDDARCEVVVALRGSATIDDIITDACMVLVPLITPGVSAPSDVRVHSGFLAAWNTIAATVIAAVRQELAAHPGYAVVTAGHSLGGALASLAALALCQSFPSRETRMYTYGQPRTGNRAYADLINTEMGGNAFRVVHANDGVPTMIPKMLGYYHHGVEYWQFIDPALPITTKRCRPHGEDILCSGSIPSTGVNLAHFIYFGIPATMPFCHCRDSGAET